MLKFSLEETNYSYSKYGEDVNISLKSMPILNEYIPAMRQYFQ